MKLKCRVCGRVEEVLESDSKDYVCSLCCDFDITDKKELRNFLKKLESKDRIIGDLREIYDENSLNEKSENVVLNLIEDFGGRLNW